MTGIFAGWNGLMAALSFKLRWAFARKFAQCPSWARSVAAAALTKSAFIILFGLASISAVRADEAIKGEVKAATDAGYLRLLFHFDEAVEATTRVSGAIVIITFNKPVAVAIEKLNVNAPEYISAARRDPDGSAIRIALLRPVKVNAIVAAERLYVDLLPESWKGPMPGIPQEVVDELVAPRARCRTPIASAARRRETEKAADGPGQGRDPADLHPLRLYNARNGQCRAGAR